MTRVLANHADVTRTTNDLALLTHCLNACANLHAVSFSTLEPELFVAVGDAATSHVVRRDLDLDLVARENSNAILAHATRAHREHGKSILQLDFEHRVRPGFHHGSLNGERIFLLLRQVPSPCCGTTTSARLERTEGDLNGCPLKVGLTSYPTFRQRQIWPAVRSIRKAVVAFRDGIDGAGSDLATKPEGPVLWEAESLGEIGKLWKFETSGPKAVLKFGVIVTVWPSN